MYRLGMVGATRAAADPMRNYVYRLVTASFRLIIPLSRPGPKVAISSSTTFSSVQYLKHDTIPYPELRGQGDSSHSHLLS